MKQTLFLCIFTAIPLVGVKGIHVAQPISLNNVAHFESKRCKQLLQEVVQQRENSGYAGRFVMKLTPYPETTFVVWGPLKGSYSSLMRTLSSIQTLGIIDQYLKIVHKDTYLVFNGDAISDSETSLETLMLILTLMKLNPTQVLYIKGEAEQELQWQNDGLKKALQQKSLSFPGQKSSITKLISRFFNTLPLALYITGINPLDGALRISYFPRTSREIDETHCGKTLTNALLNVPQICSLSSSEKAPVPIKATITSEQRLMSYQQHPGLTLVEPDKGSVTWSIFSGPTPHYQREYQFFRDAFALIKTGKTIDEALIELYSADLRTGENIHLVGSYDIMTGIERNPRQLSKKPALNIDKNIMSLYTQLESLIAQATQLTEMLIERGAT